MLKHIFRLIRFLFSQMVIVGILLVMQIAFLVVMTMKLSEYYVYINSVLLVISMIAVLSVVNRRGSPASKLAWVVAILAVPLLGGMFYLLVMGQRHPHSISKKQEKIAMYSRQYLPRRLLAEENLLRQSPDSKKMLSYMAEYAGATVYEDTEAQYYTSGEAMKDAMVAAIENAEKYVFLEFFIIKNGAFWREIQGLLARKAAQGVEIRLMYDGMGCLAHLSALFPRRLRKLGLKVKVFSPFAPFLSTMQNHRDHRKIVVVDGHTAFCGGINLADEYINATQPYGHWKDTGVRLKGLGVRAFAVMFLDMWALSEPTPENYDEYLPETPPGAQDGGFVMPYGDSPMDGEKISEYMYMRAISDAQSYLHIVSPYLIIEQAMVDAMICAAKSGIEIKLIVPARADHWYAHAVARAFYRELTLGGVKLYEYSPGFIHAKSFVWDDHSAIVGTINLDFRSLYLHYECAVWMHRCPAVVAVEEDFKATLEKCRQLLPEDTVVRNPLRRMLYSFLRIFAPLM